jgi:hypothetical protein
MRTIATIFFSVAASLLTLASAHATATQGDVSNVASAPSAQPEVVLRLAGSFHSSNAKLGDKSLDGRAGGIYGVGGSEPHVRYFKSRMKKIPRCCTGTSH